jgi:hypothetical protein
MLPSLDRKEGVEAEDLIDRISAATPGIKRGSKAMPINVSSISWMVSQKRSLRLRYINVRIDFSCLLVGALA